MFWRHVPAAARRIAALRIEIDGQLEGETIVAENIGFAAKARADEIFKLALAMQRRIAVAVEAQPSVAFFQEHAVVHARGSVVKPSGEEILCSGTAGMRHGRGGIGLKNCAV